MKVTKRSMDPGDLNVTEQSSDQIGENLKSEPVELASETPKAAADTAGEPASDSETATAPIKVEAVNGPPKQAEPQQDQSAKQPEAAADENLATAETSRTSGTVVIMPQARGKSWEGKSWDSKSWDGDAVDRDAASAANNQASGLFGKRRVSALAAVIALAAVTGAVGGAVAT